VNRRELRILFVATKPAFPPRDGGRLLIWNTLSQLAARGHRITYVAPDLGADPSLALEHLQSVCERVRLVPGKPTALLPAAFKALVGRTPMSVLRHSHGDVRRTIASEIAECPPDVIHAEQIQAFFNLPQIDPRIPVVLRAQNVESRLWRMVAQRRRYLAWPARDEARKMAALESQAIRRAARTVVLTKPDAETLAGGAGAEARRISIIRPPFPTTLPAGARTLEGDPAVVILTGGWLPNRDSLEWFLDEIWPEIRIQNPRARAHVFGGKGNDTGPAVSFHPPPSDSAEMFCSGSIVVVPLRIASGIRMKILEAWARRVPVVATSTAVGGLEDVNSGGYLRAENGRDFGSAIHRIHNDPELRHELVEAGSRAMSTYFEPHLIATRLEDTYRQAIEDRAREPK
jgi:hypothetical protein